MRVIFFLFARSFVDLLFLQLKFHTRHSLVLSKSGIVLLSFLFACPSHFIQLKLHTKHNFKQCGIQRYIQLSLYNVKCGLNGEMTDTNYTSSLPSLLDVFSIIKIPFCFRCWYSFAIFLLTVLSILRRIFPFSA